jgi:peroxiredoxin
MRIPYTNFKRQVLGEIQATDTVEIFEDKKIVVFGVPAAFTLTSTKHIKEYEDKYQEIKEQGIDEVYCTSVNDSFVMNAWMEDTEITKVKPLADGEGVFAQGMGMLVNKPAQGLGMRSWRYSMLVIGAEVKKLFEEPGKNHLSEDDDPLGLSSAENMLKFMKGKNI